MGLARPVGLRVQERLGMCCRRTHPERRPESAKGYLVTGAKHPIEGGVAVDRGAFLLALGPYER